MPAVVPSVSPMSPVSPVSPVLRAALPPVPASHRRRSAGCTTDRRGVPRHRRRELWWEYSVRLPSRQQMDQSPLILTTHLTTHVRSDCGKAVTNKHTPASGARARRGGGRGSVVLDGTDEKTLQEALPTRTTRQEEYIRSNGRSNDGSNDDTTTEGTGVVGGVVLAVRRTTRSCCQIGRTMADGQRRLSRLCFSRRSQPQ